MVYQIEDTNLKFLRSLPKGWKPMIVSLRHSQEYNDYNLEKLYGVLKIYELELQLDEEIERRKRKNKSITLVAKNEDGQADEKMEAIQTTPSKGACEGRTRASKGKAKMHGRRRWFHHPR